MTNEPESAVMTFKEFLENTPPGKSINIFDIGRVFTPLSDQRTELESIIRLKKCALLNPPNLKLHCNNDDCKGYRFFEYVPMPDTFLKEGKQLEIYAKITNKYFITYRCQNCKTSAKTFAISMVVTSEDSRDGRVFKYGESPPFGPPIPPRALTLIGADRDLFLTGRRAENQGMGIGAFAYYRRVVENQKKTIFDEIIRVISKLSPDDPIIEELKQAKKETQFTKAVDEIKHGLPTSLQINSQNPLTLLYSALSAGVHDHSDGESLVLAGDIRNVLVAFAEKLALALKEDAELNASVTRMMKTRETKKKEKESQDEN